MKLKAQIKLFRDFILLRPPIRKVRNLAVYGMSNIMKKAVIHNYTPVGCGIFITNRCNLSCNFCSIGVPQNRLEAEDIEPQRFEEILKSHLFRNAIRLSLAGGEPLMHKNFFDLVAIAKNLKFITGTNTNGLLIKKYVDRLVTSGLSYIFLSLYDDHAEHQIENLKALLDKRKATSSNLFIGISKIITAGNFHRIENVIELGKKLEVDGIWLQNTYPGGSMGLDDLLYDDNEEYKRYIKSISGKFDLSNVTFPFLVQRNRKKPIRKCPWPFMNISANSKGDIGICCFMTPSSGYGNIFENQDNWNSEFYQRLRKSFIDTSLPLNPYCENCNLLGLNPFV